MFNGCQVQLEKILDAQGDYTRYLGLFNDDAGFSSKVQADVFEYTDDYLAQEAVWETGDSSSFPVTDRFAIAAALHDHFRHFPT